MDSDKNTNITKKNHPNNSSALQGEANKTYVHRSNNSIYLRPLAQQDRKNICRWISSVYILQHSFIVQNKKTCIKDFANEYQANKYFNMLLTDQKRLTFAIMCNDVHVGTIGLKDINPLIKSAECFIEIGEAAMRGQGIGTRAMAQLLHHAFWDCGLYMVNLDVLEFNTRALKLYSRLGFQKTNSFMWHYDGFGQYWKVLRMSITFMNLYSTLNKENF